MRPRSAPGAAAALAFALGAAACTDRGLTEGGPDQHHPFLFEVTVSGTDRLYLLLVLDNSAGMADKHRLLARALPDLFAQLFAVNCENANGVRVLSEDGDCPEGFGATFTRFTDVHVGVITTSLGGHGGIACTPAEGSTFSPEMDDRGELVAPLRGVPTDGDQGFVQAPGSTASSTTQRFGKAYPAPRLLQMLKDFGFNAGVASACPKLGAKADRDAPAFGYRPAMTSLFGRRFHQEESLGHGWCVPRSLPVAEDGSPSCLLVEVTHVREGIRCDSPGRAPLAPAVAAVALQRFRETGRCDSDPANPCSDYLLCEMPAAQGEDLERCLELTDRELGQDTVGYCYLDAGQDRDGDGVARCAYDPEHPEA
ncbi:MAG: hypothetical protein JW751_19680 [Polyangiaceae bacterium]|nr:hypothetical protein [Polyangiaceae bacterium]